MMGWLRRLFRRAIEAAPSSSESYVNMVVQVDGPSKRHWRGSIHHARRD